MYYKGNTIGLNYDAATGNWSFSTEPNDFIDTDAFSTADPKFDFVPPSNTTPDEPENDPCPAGYKYDSTLKQCVLTQTMKILLWMNKHKLQGVVVTLLQ